MAINIVASMDTGVPDVCDGCSGELPQYASRFCVGSQKFHSRDCYDRIRPAADVWRDRCCDVDRLEFELSHAKRRRDEAAKRMGG